MKCVEEDRRRKSTTFKSPDSGDFRVAADTGVVVHAAIYFSMLEKVGKVERWGAFILDIVLGVLFGYLFHSTWGRYEEARGRLLVSDEGAWIWPYLRARGWLFLNIGLVALAVWCLVLVSGWVLYPQSIWVNPGPIVIGLSIKSYLASRDAPRAVEHPSTAEDTHRPEGRMPVQAVWFERALWMGVVVWCLVALAAH